MKIKKNVQYGLVISLIGIGTLSVSCINQERKKVNSFKHQLSGSITHITERLGPTDNNLCFAGNVFWQGGKDLADSSCINDTNCKIDICGVNVVFSDGFKEKAVIGHIGLKNTFMAPLDQQYTSDVGLIERDGMTERLSGMMSTPMPHSIGQSSITWGWTDCSNQLLTGVTDHSCAATANVAKPSCFHSGVGFQIKDGTPGGNITVPGATMYYRKTGTTEIRTSTSRIQILNFPSCNIKSSQ